MEFFETPVFTKRINQLISDEDYHLLQLKLTIWPETGELIKHSGGLRKIRWAPTGRGKSSGIRVIYYYIEQNARIFMLFAYSKKETDDLTPGQVRQLRRLVQEHLQ